MTFVCWMCQPCLDKYGKIAGTMLVPDAVFFERVKQEQVAKYGRVLSAEETVLSLADPNSLESKLARDRVALTPKLVQ